MRRSSISLSYHERLQYILNGKLLGVVIKEDTCSIWQNQSASREISVLILLFVLSKTRSIKVRMQKNILDQTGPTFLV